MCAELLNTSSFHRRHFIPLQSVKVPIGVSGRAPESFIKTVSMPHFLSYAWVDLWQLFKTKSRAFDRCVVVNDLL